VGDVNRSGHGNEFHSHPGGYWSGVYYVDDGGIADVRRWAASSSSWIRADRCPRSMPASRRRHAGRLKAGANEAVIPKAGRLVMFPSCCHQCGPIAAIGAHLHRLQSHRVKPRREGYGRIAVARVMFDR